VTIAALFVETNGCYFNLEGVDAWDESRDARLYDGPHAVIAHPPCQRWGRYWSGGPSARERRILGDDGGCFVAAIRAVRKWGGVLEHPEASHAWSTFGIPAPAKSGGWEYVGKGAYTCCVEQGHYGHPARKATWLYAVEIGWPLPELKWGPSSGRRLDEGFHSKQERDAARAAGRKPVERLSTAENLATPIAFRDVLIGMARSVRREQLTIEGAA
jgi:hypothetical protein